MGTTKRPFYRVVAADKARARDGRFIEILGHYNPKNFPESVVLKEDRIKEWISKGAQPTDAVKKLMSSKGLLKQN
jgi:small subunit ribosomal protein S16